MPITDRQYYRDWWQRKDAPPPPRVRKRPELRPWVAAALAIVVLAAIGVAIVWAA